jgi:hypothetical protein
MCPAKEAPVIPEAKTWKKWKQQNGITLKVRGINMGEAFQNYHDSVPNPARSDPQGTINCLEALWAVLTKYNVELKRKYPPTNKIHAELKTTFSQITQLKQQMLTFTRPFEALLDYLRKVEKEFAKNLRKPTAENEWKTKFHNQHARGLQIQLKQKCGAQTQMSAKFAITLRELESHYDPAARMFGGKDPWNTELYKYKIAMMLRTLREMGSAYNLWRDPGQPPPPFPGVFDGRRPLPAVVRTKENWIKLLRMEMKGPPRKPLPMPPGS